MNMHTQEKRFEDILAIPGFSKNQLRKLKQVMSSLFVNSYTIGATSVDCVIKVGTLDYKVTFNLNNLQFVKNVAKSHYEIINKLKNNHSDKYGSYRNYYTLFIYEVNNKFYLSPKYSFNATTTDIAIPNEEVLFEWINERVKKNSLVITEDILFIPKGLLISDLKEACRRYMDNFRREGYAGSACLFQEWNYPYKIFRELSIYSTDEFDATKEIFVQKCSLHQLAWVKVKYPNIYLPQSASERERHGHGTWEIEKNLKDKVFNLKNFEEKYQITKEFKQKAKDLSKLKRK